MGKQCAGTIRLPAALSKQAVFWHGNTAASEWLETPIFSDLKKARTQTTFPAARRLASGQFLNRLVARLFKVRAKRRRNHELSQLSQHLPEIIHPKTPPGHSIARGRLPMPRHHHGLTDLWETVSQPNTIGSRPAKVVESIR